MLRATSKEGETIMSAKLVVFVTASLLIVIPSLARADQASLLIPNNAPDNYNYVPTVMNTSDGVQRIWWCGGPNDTIFYQSFDLNNGGQTITPKTAVLVEGPPGAWDSVFVCDPSVTKGSWNNPLGDGVTYSYAMYYSGTDNSEGHSGVGVAFSNDGVSWNKYPYPIYRNPPAYSPAFVRPSNPQGLAYGLGEQSVLSAAGGSELYLFVLNVDNEPQYVQLFHSTDGLHLDLYSNVTTAGLIPDSDGIAVFNEPDFAYDDATAKLYVVTNRTNTPGILDIYRISWDQLSSGSWEYLASLGPGTAYNPTGSPLNANAGLQHNEFGRLGLFLPNIITYFSAAPSADTVQPSSIWWWITTVN